MTGRLGTITIAVSCPFRQFVPSSFQGTGARNGAERNPRFARCEHSSKAVFAVRFVLLFVPGFAEHPYTTFILHSPPILTPIGRVVVHCLHPIVNACSEHKKNIRNPSKPDRTLRLPWCRTGAETAVERGKSKLEPRIEPTPAHKMLAKR
jgi:hypothetical protein